jgi:hypothetical protein
VSEDDSDAFDQAETARFPFTTAILRANLDGIPYHKKWWRHIRHGTSRKVIHLMCLHDAIERMLADPIENPEAAVDVLIAERFMNGACDVPGWEDADPDDQPVKFIGPDQVAHELDPWP